MIDHSKLNDHPRCQCVVPINTELFEFSEWLNRKEQEELNPPVEGLQPFQQQVTIIHSASEHKVKKELVINNDTINLPMRVLAFDRKVV
jgi:hypothetical protein